MVEKLNCMVRGDVDQVYQDVHKLIGTGCMVPDACCRQQGLYFKSLVSMGDSQLYNLEVCRRTLPLSSMSSVEEIKKAYVDCQISAKKFYCIDFATSSARDYFSKEYNKWGTVYSFWSHPTSSESRDEMGTGASSISPAQGDESSGWDMAYNFSAHSAIRSGDSFRAQDDCGSPRDCYTQAISKLNEARAEIKDKANMAAVQFLIDARTQEEQVQTQELKVFYGDRCPNGWMEADVTKGYMLVGRPQGGKTRTRINAAFTNGEKSRVVPHGHQAIVTDRGHSHTITDPGHSHSFGVHGDYKGYHQGGVWTDFEAYGTTSTEKTGVTAVSGKANIAVSVGDAHGEGYPLVYVLLCQRSPKTGTSSTRSMYV